MKPLRFEQISPGLEVVFIDRSLNVGDCIVPSSRTSVPLDGRRGVVVRVSDEPGKRVTVVLAEPHELAHTCDGFAPDKHGVWALAEHLYTVEDHEAHKTEHAAAKAQHEKREAEKADALAVAKRFLRLP